MSQGGEKGQPGADSFEVQQEKLHLCFQNSLTEGPGLGLVTSTQGPYTWCALEEEVTSGLW